MEPIGWRKTDEDYDWFSIVHEAKWGKNEVTGKKTGGPRFGVMVILISMGSRGSKRNKV